MKHIIAALAMLLPLCSGAQSPPVKPLSIGDTVPDIILRNVYNYKTGAIHFSALKGKPVILDFWATWCGSCIATFPEMGKLQKQFEGRVQMIMVNSYYPDSSKKVKSFFQKREQRTGKPFDLVYALQDTLLSQLFPYKQIPHDVWINANGTVIAITGASEVNKDNIQALLKNGTIDLPVKNDNLLFNAGIPLLVGENSSNNPSFLYRSVITGYKKNLGTSIGQTVNEEGKITRVFVINSPLLTLLQKAYPEVFSIPLNRMIVEADSSTRNSILNPKGPKYCYEIITAPSTAQEIQNFEQQDLFRWFRLVAKNDVRGIDCYILKTNNGAKKEESIGGASQIDAEPETENKIFINQPVSALTSFLERVTHKTVLDETGFPGHIDLKIRDIYDFSMVQVASFLSSNGFQLIPVVRKMKAIVIVQQ